MTTNFNENLPSSECQSSSIIQETGGRIEEERSKTGKSRRGQRIGGRKNIE